MKKYWQISLCFLVLGLGTVCCAGATEVEITSPVDEDTVSMIGEDIEGTSKGIPEGYELWITVYPDGVNRHFPQDKRNLPIIMMANGDWTAEAVIGSPPDHDMEFKLYAILADETANAEILEYLDGCIVNESWPGLEQLPDGAEIYDYVTVIRE